MGGDLGTLLGGPGKSVPAAKDREDPSPLLQR